MAAEHAGAEGPDPRALVERLRRAADNLPALVFGDHACLDKESTRNAIDLHRSAADALEAALARAEAAEADRGRCARQLQDAWSAKEIYGPPLTVGTTDDGRRIRAIDSEIAPGKAVLVRNRTEEAVEIAIGKESWWTQLEEKVSAALARAEKAERELATVIEKWPTEDTAGIAAPGILGEYEEGWTCNTGGFPTPEAAVRAYCGLDPAPAGGGG